MRVCSFNSPPTVVNDILCRECASERGFFGGFAGASSTFANDFNLSIEAFAQQIVRSFVQVNDVVARFTATSVQHIAAAALHSSALVCLALLQLQQQGQQLRCICRVAAHEQHLPCSCL
jgi:hypothetical protein